MDKNLSIEQIFKRLDEIVSLMENDNISIDEMVSLYDEGSELFKKCKKRILSTESKIKVISKKYK